MTHLSSATFIVISSIALSACTLEFGDLNQPDLYEELRNPTAASLAAAAAGLIALQRADTTTKRGFTSQAGIVGRESYVLDPSDPRFQTELLIGTADGESLLNPGNPAFGGNHWASYYQTIRQAEEVIKAARTDAAATFLTPAEVDAVHGWALFHQAYALGRVIDTHLCPAVLSADPRCHSTSRLVFGAVLAFEAIDPFSLRAIEPETLEQLTPIVREVEPAVAKVLSLYDASIAALQDAGDERFPFELSSGFKNFDTPARLMLAVQAVKARHALYAGDFATAAQALDASFLDTADTSFVDGMENDIGIFHSFSAGTGDATNGFFADPDILAHPSFEIDAERQADGTTLDARFLQKLRFNRDSDGDGRPDPTQLSRLSSTLNFGGLYPTSSTPIPYIRNEELILIRAELLTREGRLNDAAQLVNFIRMNSGQLEPKSAAVLDSEQALLTEILAQRRYSLMFEGGHRWLDTRRLRAIETLPIDRSDDIVNLVWPVEQTELDSRVSVMCE